MADVIQFISTDAEQIVAEMVAYYQGLTGKTLQSGQIEKILINVFAYREQMLRQGINEAAMTQLLDFSRAPMIDYLVALVGVKRLSAQYAKTTIQYALVNNHNGVTIPQGHRVASADGKVTFATTITQYVPAGTYEMEVPAEATVAGVIGNDYAINSVNDITDPLPYILSAANLTKTAGGAEQETDDQLKVRTKLAPFQYSTAGAEESYRFWALSANPTIVDVSVTSPIPGQVKLCVLLKDGVPATTDVLDDVLASCNPKKRRPINDDVVAVAPTPVSYDIDIDLTMFNTADDANALINLRQMLSDYAQERKQLLGKDVTRAKITSICMSEGLGVYDPLINFPVADVIVGDTEFASIGTITVNIVGHTNG